MNFFKKEKLSDVIIIDNFLSESYFKILQDMVTSEFFPWSFTREITNTNIDSRLGSYGFQFLLGDYDNFRRCSETDLTMGCLKTIGDYLNAKRVFKARYDMTLYNSEKFLHKPHIDGDHIPNYFSTILYMNNSDGDTVIYNEKCYKIEEMDYDMQYTIKKTVTPKENRLVLFEGNVVHTGYSPSNNKNRILLNAVFDLG